MLIKTIEQKIKLSLIVSVCSLVTACVISIGAMVLAYRKIGEERKKIYVLDHTGTPFSADQTDMQVNRPVEYLAHIELFHNTFFSLTPDNVFIEAQMKRAMNWIDETGMAQYNNLKEAGYFNSILSSSAVITLKKDSIVLNGDHFTYYGKQRIERPSNISTRSLITVGSLQDIPRSENNAHGVLITKWKTIENKDLTNVSKNNL